MAAEEQRGGTVAGCDWWTEGVEGRKGEMESIFLYTEGIQCQK